MKKKPFVRPDSETIRLSAGDVVVTSGTPTEAGEAETDKEQLSDFVAFP